MPRGRKNSIVTVAVKKGKRTLQRGKRGIGAKGRASGAKAVAQRGLDRNRASRWFPVLGRMSGGGGLGVLVVVVEAAEEKWDVAAVMDDRTIVTGRGGRRDRAVGGVELTSRAARAIASKARVRRLSRTVAALGHPARVAMLVKLLEGPATYRTLQKVSGLKAGPLYHHINQLRLVSLILPKERDLYAMTRAGRNVLLGGLALMTLAKDVRERPSPRG